MSFRDTQWAVHDPDIYSGPRCNQVRPRWRCEAADDKGGADHQFKPLALDARTFSAGTKITISEPTCPQCECHCLRQPIVPIPKKYPFFEPKCHCGFDWEAWTQNEFS